MGRLIDSQTAYDVLTDYYHHSTDAQHAALREALGQVESVDAVPVVHGHWIYHPEWVADGECGYECSECGRGVDLDYAYCPHCGARMDGKDGENNDTV